MTSLPWRHERTNELTKSTWSAPTEPNQYPPRYAWKKIRLAHFDHALPSPACLNRAIRHLPDAFGFALRYAPQGGMSDIGDVYASGL